MRAADAAALSSVSEDTLVARAGTAVGHAAVHILGGAYGRRVTVIVGKGNNGADGRVAAAFLARRGARVSVIAAADAPRALAPADLVIDGAYGTGFRGAYDAPEVPPGVPVLSIDIPSGVDADTGEGPGAPFSASHTVTFAAYKTGLLQGAGPGHSGTVQVADIGIPLATARAALIEDADIAATLLYPVTARPFRELYDLACTWSERQRAEVIDVALQSRTRRDEILAGFRGGLYAYDFVMDIGAFRDLHRHRRCQKFRQPYSGNLGFDTPKLVTESGAGEIYTAAMQAALAVMHSLPAGACEYLLPFGARSRFLFKMDFAEAEYISRLRSGVKGHFSYREIAWDMKLKMEQLEPELGRLIDATPPWVEDPLKR